MAFVNVRHASMLIGSKKVAECYKSDATIDTGDELAFGDAGVIGVTDGAASTQFNFDMIIPVAGATVNPEVMAIKKQSFTLQYGVVGGKIWSCVMRFKQAKVDSDAKSGMLSGSYQAIGGEPTIS